MGTRADFYVGNGAGAEWIGSIAYDGYRSGIPKSILRASDEEDFREAVFDMLDDRDDATTPEQGWPWPWETSATTDCSYWFFDGHVWEASKDWDGVTRDADGRWVHNDYYVLATKPVPDFEDFTDPETARKLYYESKKSIVYPNMKDRMNVAMDGRSGLLFVSVPG